MERVCRVLVVEDNHDIRDLLADVFDHEGYRFTLASNGAEMRGALAGGDIDVVIIDVVLPGESGLALAKEAADRGCGVILVTGHHDHFETVYKSGHRYAFKPYRLKSLLALVDEALREAKARCRVKDRRYG